jgi:hypothetical protein
MAGILLRSDLHQHECRPVFHRLLQTEEIIADEDQVAFDEPFSSLLMSDCNIRLCESVSCPNGSSVLAA